MSSSESSARLWGASTKLKTASKEAAKEAAESAAEQARDGALELTYVPTNRNWGDGMTKSLAAPAFTAFAHALGVHDRPATRGSPS